MGSTYRSRCWLGVNCSRMLVELLAICFYAFFLPMVAFSPGCLCCDPGSCCASAGTFRITASSITDPSVTCCDEINGTWDYTMVDDTICCVEMEITMGSCYASLFNTDSTSSGTANQWSWRVYSLSGEDCDISTTVNGVESWDYSIPQLCTASGPFTMTAQAALGWATCDTPGTVTLENV